eukprot:15481459-Alexandrium_andersonii.AAC.1
MSIDSGDIGDSFERCGCIVMDPDWAAVQRRCAAQRKRQRDERSELSRFSSLRMLRAAYCVLRVDLQLNSRTPARCELGPAICVYLATVCLPVEVQDLRVQVVASRVSGPGCAERKLAYPDLRAPCLNTQRIATAYFDH